MFFICSASTYWMGPSPLSTPESIVQTSMIDGNCLLQVRPTDCTSIWITESWNNSNRRDFRRSSLYTTECSLYHRLLYQLRH